MAENILDTIIKARRLRLDEARALVPLSQLKALAAAQPPPRLDFKQALSTPSPAGIHIIAEVKKASPSKGVIRADFHPLEIAKIYAEAGATALSVLTEQDHFQGHDEYLREIAARVDLPCLRKDFIVDAYQIYEARALGASAFLLIAACLDAPTLREFIALGKDLGMSALVEIHNRREAESALAAGAELIGINNRDLRTFITSLEVTWKLRPLIPAGIPVISESGIFTTTDMEDLKREDVAAALVGESLMREKDPGNKLRELLGR